jgi:hypothetical protein
MEDRKTSIAQSIVYYRIAAVASLLCGTGSVILGAVTLQDADGGRVFVGIGLSQIALGLVMLSLALACLQIVARLRAQLRRLR